MTETEQNEPPPLIIPGDFLPSTMVGAAKWVARSLEDNTLNEPDAVIVHRDRVAVMLPYTPPAGPHRLLAELLRWADQLDSALYRACLIQRTSPITLITVSGQVNGFAVEISGNVNLIPDRLNTAPFGKDVVVPRSELEAATRP